MKQILALYPEPKLLFKNDQMMLDPRDGLALFGPLDHAKPEGIRWAVVGTRDAIRRLQRWVSVVQHEVIQGKDDPARPVFPGFKAAFHSKMSDIPVISREIDVTELDNTLRLADSHQRIYRLVDLFYQQIVQAMNTEDVRPDIWFVVIPEEIYLY